MFVVLVIGHNCGAAAPAVAVVDLAVACLVSTYVSREYMWGWEEGDEAKGQLLTISMASHRRLQDLVVAVATVAIVNVDTRYFSEELNIQTC